MKKQLTWAGLAVLTAFCGGAETRRGLSESRLVSGDGSVDWNRYYTAGETNRILQEFSEMYPELTELRSIGKSYLGTELMLMEVTNEKTGPAGEKPALYLDGGIHARELTGSAVALYVLAHLVNQFDSDPEVTELLDTHAFYIRPKFNPDGSDLALKEDQWLRSTVRPVDEDADGIADNDPPQDLDGDGRILQMRSQDPEGQWRISPDDSRIMLRRSPGDAGPFYRLLREGVDTNGDGSINSDGIGGIDMNRNFPRNWERWHIQGGSGDFPLSEPETYATVRFLNEHRNVAAIVHGHTSGGFVYRLPSAMDPAEFPAEDEALVIALGEVYTRQTGRPVRPSATHPTQRRYGTLIQWGYSDQGIVGWVPEYSPAPEQWVPDLDGDGLVTETDWHRYNEEEFQGRYFADWTPYEHPQLGSVEIGGWWTLYWGQNPPPELLERELALQLPWILYLAGQSPLLELAPLQVTRLGEDHFQVEVTVSNRGYLPTHLTQRGYEGRRRRDGTVSWQVVPPPLVVLTVQGGSIETGNGRVRIDHLAGSSTFSPAVEERSRTLRFTVIRESPGASVQVTVLSDKAGTVRSPAVPLQ